MCVCAAADSVRGRNFSGVCVRVCVCCQGGFACVLLQAACEVKIFVVCVVCVGVIFVVGLCVCVCVFVCCC